VGFPPLAETLSTADWGAIRTLYPALAGLEPAPGQLTHARVDSGTVLFEEGAPCRGFPFVLRGEVRVARGSPGGRMLELYRVTPGELCIVSTSCLFGTRPLSAAGVATMPTEVLMLSPGTFSQWCAHEPFRRFVFGIFADRMVDLMALTEAVAFQRLDQRLAAALMARGPLIHGTHQALADELGTVREIVSRLLRRFEREGWLRGAREQIELLDTAALQRLAAGDLAPPGERPPAV
jgi:CRP/FNR family transcriptional regulator, anaerobic regulatory protein